MPRYSDTVDLEEDLNNLGDGGSSNGSPFARLGTHQTSGVQIKEWSHRLSEGLSLTVHPWKSQPEHRQNKFPENYPKAGYHPTKIPHTWPNRVGQLSQVRSGQHCKVPG